ncbi:MAG: HDIG domain-containing metalloprotein, partial [Phycisphaerales bacterium]
PVRALSAFPTVGATTPGAGLHLALFYPPSERRPARLALLAAIATGCFGIAVWGADVAPNALYLVATLPTLFFGAVLVIVYDQRCALLLIGLHAALLSIALQLPLSFALGALAVGATLIAQLAEIRQRTTVLRAGMVTAVAAFVVTLVIGLFDRSLFDPSAAGRLVTPVRRELFIDASLFAGSAVCVAFLTLGLLPIIERMFDVLTGMRLIELRDPKQPLLRRLAQRAPGTYTHSITVAALAESAADAVGADALHVYVGALYHDIGKMNKPDYFVENQGGGFNRHTKLSPAMSLLVIVGHVKDGAEMAVEEGLPRSLRHYIESHHGTTLVEYFYHRAKEQAEENREDAPAEVGYRYPGPKPQTKEAAILMLCDAVESATRALAEPTPSRIESVVRTISLKRLMDGQFDESDLTLRELQVIEDAVIKSLNSIYHGRIAYPGGPMHGEKDKAKTAKAATPGGGGGGGGAQPLPVANDPNAQRAQRAAGA